MPLILKPLKKESETIEFKEQGVKLNVPGQAPMELMVEFLGLRDIDLKNYKQQDLELAIALIKRILYLENDQKMVDDFFKTLIPEHVEEIILFVTNYILAGMKGKKKVSGTE